MQSERGTSVAKTTSTTESNNDSWKIDGRVTMKDKCDKKKQQKSFPYYAMATSFFYIYVMATSFFYIYAMATSFFYIYVTATSFFYIYVMATSFF